MRKIELLLTALLFISVSALYSQEEITVPRRLYLFVNGKTGITPRMERVLDESLILLISRHMPVVVIEAEKKQPVPGSDADKTALAERFGADAWLDVKVDVQGNLSNIRARLFDIEEYRLVFEKDLAESSTGGRVNEEFWKELLSELRDVLAPRRQQVRVEQIVKRVKEVQVIEHPQGVEVMVKGVPGSKIRGLGKGSLIVDASGSAALEVPQSATFRLRATHWKYYPETEKFYVGHEPVTITLQQRRGSRVGLEILTDFDRTTGLGVSYYIIPNYFFTNFRLVNSFFRPIPPFIGNRENDWDRRNLEFSLRLGRYFLTPDAFIRFSIAVGALLKLHFPEGARPRLHPVFPSGLSLSINIELSRSERYRFFFEWSPEIYIETPVAPGLFYLGSPYFNYNQKPWEDFTRWGDFAIEMGKVNVGLRIQF